MDKCREAFEEIEKVKEILVDYANEVVFNELEGKYIAPCYQTFIPEYLYELNFGWNIFQEQQKKVDEMKSLVCVLWTELDDRNSKEYIIEGCEPIIQELLND